MRNTYSDFSWVGQDTVEYVVHLHTSGNEAEAIAKHTGLSFWTVLAILSKLV